MPATFAVACEPRAERQRESSTESEPEPCFERVAIGQPQRRALAEPELMGAAGGIGSVDNPVVEAFDREPTTRSMEGGGDAAGPSDVR